LVLPGGPTTKGMHASATWRQGCEVVVEDDHGHHLSLDLPADEGGRSSGPSAVELPLLALAGSLATAFAQTARRRGLPLEGVTLALEAERRLRAPAIDRIHGVLRARTRAPTPEVEAVFASALKSCPVGDLFERAGVPIDVACVVLVPHVHA
jgi:uncharacterized OsmC-like protein